MGCYIGLKGNTDGGSSSGALITPTRPGLCCVTQRAEQGMTILPTCQRANEQTSKADVSNHQLVSVSSKNWVSGPMLDTVLVFL